MTETSLEVFNMLAQSLPMPGELIELRTDLGSRGRSIVRAVDSAGLPLLIVPLVSSDPDWRDNDSRGVDVATYPYRQSEQAETGRAVYLRCDDRRVTSQFAYMVDDMIMNLSSQQRSASLVCMEVLDRWRELLGDAPSKLLSVSAQIGLLVELHLLEQALRTDPHFNLDSWRGPDKSRHDFVTERAAVEVKGTTNKDEFIVQIHGLWQLERPSTKDLFLYAERLEQVPLTSGESITDLVKRIIELDIDRVSFLKAIALVGYDPADDRSYLPIRFSVLERRLWKVDAAFPRLTRETLHDPTVADAIVAVEYGVNLNSVESLASGEHALRVAAQRLVQDA